MNNKIEIIFATSNWGKYNFLNMMLYTQDELILDRFVLEGYNLRETDNSKLNAQIKAIEISKILKGLILSSDDSLVFLNASSNSQPKANIYRKISPQKNTEEIIRHYIHIIKRSKNNSINAKLTSYYSIAKGGYLIKDFVYSYEMILRIPKYLNFEVDMPLSVLHYIEEKNKFYFELSFEEKFEFHKPFLNSFKLYISKIK